MIAYRSDIDGLRAVAVVAVILFHAGTVWFTGGFVGVDIFFVISGYLITSIIWREMRGKGFDFGRFYVRRARRILPALFVVLVATLAAGAVLLTPNELRAVGRNVASTACFGSNIDYLVNRGAMGYFGEAADTKPLLHTWSLAIEEQFYFVWPATLIFASRWRRGPACAVVLTIAISFALACFTVRSAPDVAFYLPFTRAWELACGAALAMWPPAPWRVRWVPGALSLVGAVMVLGSMLLLDRHSVFPGWNAAPSCLGAVLLIAAGEGGWVNRLLATRPMVFTGRISYSLYLWHWPLLVYNVLTVYGPERARMIPWLVVAAFVLATLSWRFVESPFRVTRSRRSARAVLTRYGAASAAVASVGALVYLAHGFPRRVSTTVTRLEAAAGDGTRSGCLRPPDTGAAPPGEECWPNRATYARALAVWGDSHADASIPGYRDLAERHRYSCLELATQTCLPLVGARVASSQIDVAGCDAASDAAMKLLLASPEIRVVVLAARWAAYSETSRFGDDDPGAISYLVDDASAEWSKANTRRVLHDAMKRTVDTLLSAGKTVVVQSEVPEIGLAVPRCLAHESLLGSSPQQGACVIDSKTVGERDAFIERELEAYSAAEPRLHVAWPRRILCDASICATFADGQVLYYDDDHLSAPGARWLVPRMGIDAYLPR